jgi:ABC-type multidrug transport system permease subunit
VEPPSAGEKPSFSALTVELIEQTAALFAERLSAPIRRVGATAARGVLLAGLASAAAGVGFAFLGAAVGLGIALARDTDRWWIALLAALGFFAIAAIIGYLGFGRKPRQDTGGTE